MEVIKATQEEQDALSSIELAAQSRLLFELFVRNQAERHQESLKNKSSLTLHSLIETVGSSYGWLASLTADEHENYRQAVQEIGEYQQVTLQETGTPPTGRELYVAFRRHIETSDSIDPSALAAVHLIEAVLDGDLKSETFPNLY